MSKGIIIFGSSGSGKTTLGKMVAQRLSFPYFDIDDYIWRKDTDQPYTVMYTREEKASRLMEDISKYPYFVMAGSMSSFHEKFDPLFELAIHLTADTNVRLERVHRRAIERFGQRVLEGGDLFETHKAFLDRVARYDTDGSPNLKEQIAWGEAMPCQVLHLDGQTPLEENCNLITEAYKALTEHHFQI